MKTRPTHAEIMDVVNGPVRPFSAKRPRTMRQRERKWKHTVLFGDTHVPFQDEKALAAVGAIIKDVEPDTIIHVGDLLDCYGMSPKFLTDPMHEVSLQGEIDQAREVLHQISTLAPDAEKVWLEGNHEDRLRKTIWDAKGAIKSLVKLRVFQQNITWPVLLGLDEIGWSFVPTHGQAKVPLLPKMVIKHGGVVRKWSGQTAQAEFQKYGKSGASGHTHRLGKFYHRTMEHSSVWVETGCTCRLDPEYSEDPDWQHGCVVVAHTADGSRFHIDDVYIHDDGAVFWRSGEPKLFAP